MTPCLLSTRSINNKGYARFDAYTLHHRQVYESIYGLIPKELELDHLCRVPRCINPEHLEPVTHAENMRRARNIHCKQGHILEGNTKGNRRECRTCHARRQRGYRYANSIL